MRKDDFVRNYIDEHTKEITKEWACKLNLRKKEEK